MGAKNAQSSFYGKSDVPGPGTYAPVNVNHTSFKYTMKGKYKMGASILITPEGGHETMIE